MVAILTTGFCGPATSFEFERQGGTVMIHTDVPVICAACPNVVEKSIFGHPFNLDVRFDDSPSGPILA